MILWYNYRVPLFSKPKKNRGSIAVGPDPLLPLPPAPPLVVHCDGACNPNPGPMRVGYLVEVDPSRVLVRVGAGVGVGTNNEAEYHALLGAMRHCLKLGLWNITLISDSLLVVQQVKGLWRVSEPRLRRLRDEARSLHRLFHRCDLRHRPRSENTVADALGRVDVYQEPELRPTGAPETVGDLEEWQAAAIRVWWASSRPGYGTLSRVFGVFSDTVHKIVQGETYKGAGFRRYPAHIRRILEGA